MRTHPPTTTKGRGTDVVTKEIDSTVTARRAPAPLGWLPLVGVGALAAATFLLLRTALVDDAYITLAYARNVAFHGTWGLLSDITSNTATSPLWVIVLSVVTFVVRRPVLALGILHVAIAVGLAASLRSSALRTGLPGWVGPLAAVAVGVNPLLLSSVGLESAFVLLLLSLLLRAGIAGRAVPYGLLAGAVVLARMDAAVAVVVVTLLLPAVLRRLHVAVGASLVVAVPWLAFSWVFLGSALPDTLVLKVQQSSWGPWDVRNGALLYVQVFAENGALAFLPVLLGALGWLVLAGFALHARSRAVDAVDVTATGAHPAGAALRPVPWLALGLGGAAHYAALSVLGVPPYHWYYSILVGTTTIVAAAAVGACWGRAASSPLRPVGWGALVAAAAIAVVSGVADVRHGTPWPIAPVQTNFATPAQYDEIAEDVEARLAAEGGPRYVTSPGEIGHLAYACDCVVDQFADPGRIQPQIDAALESSSGVVRELLELNYRFRDDPEPVPVAYDLFRYDRGTEPPGSTWWPITTTWAMPLSSIVMLPAGQQ